LRLLAFSTFLFNQRLLAAADKAFDDLGNPYSLSFKTPMDTIAGLTDWAQSINHVYGITTLIVVLIFFAVCLPLVYAIKRFGVKDEDIANLDAPKQIHGNTFLEITWTVVPIILLIFIALPTWKSIFEFRVNHAPANAMKIKVIGHQWWWEFQYPDLGITTASELHLPENTPVVFEITSGDVIHSFWVPQFGGKMDALPGVLNYMSYTTPPVKDKAKSEKAGGDYFQGQCAELCGDSHALMRFMAVLQTQEQFSRWAKAKTAQLGLASIAR
jgi:cytochrome c oxidase subunit 2